MFPSSANVWRMLALEKSLELWSKLLEMSHYSLVDELKDIHGENVSSQLATNYHVALEAYLQAQEGCDLFCKGNYDYDY